MPRNFGGQARQSALVAHCVAPGGGRRCFAAHLKRGVRLHLGNLLALLGSSVLALLCLLQGLPAGEQRGWRRPGGRVRVRLHCGVVSSVKGLFESAEARATRQCAPLTRRRRLADRGSIVPGFFFWRGPRVPATPATSAYTGHVQSKLFVMLINSSSACPCVLRRLLSRSELFCAPITPLAGQG